MAWPNFLAFSMCLIAWTIGHPALAPLCLFAAGVNFGFICMALTRRPS